MLNAIRQSLPSADYLVLWSCIVILPSLFVLR